MIPVWISYPPTIQEIQIIDPVAEREAKLSLEPDLAEMGYVLSSIKVFKLADIQIVRADVVVPETMAKVGEAIRVLKDGEIDEGINLHSSR